MNLFRSVLLFGGAVVAGGACGEEAPPQPMVVPVIEGHAAAAPGDFDKVAFACCAEPGRAEVILALTTLGSRLAADDLGGSKVAAADLAAKSKALGGGPDGTVFLDLGSRAERAAGAAEIEGVRVELQGLTDVGLALAQASPGGSARFALTYCPMKPGSWLQAGEPLANPYYGAAMLRCGSFQAPAPKSP
jgi:hypothetical protein